MQIIMGIKRCGTQHSFGVNTFSQKAFGKEVRKGMLAIIRLLRDPGQGVEGERHFRQRVGGEKILAEDRKLCFWNSGSCVLLGISSGDRLER